MAATHRRPRLIPWLLAAGTSVSVAAALTGLTACPSSACPYPNVSDIKIDPPTPCMQVAVESCLHPTLEVRNQCADGLYLPTDYGLFTMDVREEPELEVRSMQNVTYEIRREKATAVSTSKEDFVIPVRVGTQPVTISFSILSEN